MAGADMAGTKGRGTTGLLVVPGFALLLACGGGGGGASTTAAPGQDPGGGPTLDSINPGKGVSGADVVIQGSRFGSYPSVTFEGTGAWVLDASPTRIVVQVPFFAETETGPKGVVVHADGGASAPFPTPFQVLPGPPTLSGTLPTSASVGDSITLVGSNLATTTAVTVGGVMATQGTASGTQVPITVPAGASSGNVVLTTPGGTASASFTLLDPTPDRAMITGFDPLAAVPLATVTIKGTGLGEASAVAFGGVPASSFTLPRAGRNLTAVVPPGARTGPVTVTTPAGDVRSTVDFQVLRPSASGPRISGFDPTSGDGNEIFLIQGSGLASVTSYRIGDQPLTVLGSPTDSFALAEFPELVRPVSGPLRATSSQGETTAATPFTALLPALAVSRMAPVRAAVGQTVTILGTALDLVTSVNFPGGASVTAFPERSSLRLRVPVPAEAGSGPLVLNAPGTPPVATESLTIVPAGSPPEITMNLAYVTQSVQDGTLPLVAGRPGVCRVFLTATGPNAFRPAVRITLRAANGSTVLEKVVPAPGSSVPQSLVETDRAWDLPVPGALIQPGLTLQATVLPAPSLPATLPTFPATGGPLALEVVSLPPLRLNLVPIQTRAAGGRVLTGNVNQAGRTVEDWLQGIRAYYPIADVDVQVAAPWDAGIVIRDSNGSDDVSAMVRRLEASRILAVAGAGADRKRFWIGVFSRPVLTDSPVGQAAGIAKQGVPEQRTALVWDGGTASDDQNYFGTLAHELGHLLGRYHAPCGGAGGPDRFFSPRPCGLGAGAYDVAANAPIPADTRMDLMGYEYPRWAGLYTAKGLLNSFQADKASPATELAAQDCLLVSGGSGPDGVVLDPAVAYQGTPDLVPPGDWSLQFLDAQGNLLLAVPFAPSLYPESTDRYGFLFSLPFPADLKAALASIQVVQGTTTMARAVSLLALRRDTPREPTAVAWSGGRVRVSYDPSAYPRVFVRDPRSGEVRAAASDGAAEFVSDAKELELILCDGVRTQVKRVRVAP